MKTKEFNKKLSLKKQTVSNLENAEMSLVKGGAYTRISCQTIGLVCSQPECCEWTTLCKTINC